MRKFVLFIVLLLVLTIAFLLIILVFNRDEGKGALQVTSVPESQVFVDSKFVGNTPICLCEPPQLLESGDYTLKLIPIQKDLKTSEQKITIYQGVLTVVDKTFDKNNSAASGSMITLSPLDNNSTELMVISFPSKARVVMDSNSVGETPILLKDVTSSDHEIKILKEGYREKIAKVKTIEGKRLEINATLGIKTDAEVEKDKEEEGQKLSKVIILETPTGFLRVRKEASVNSEQIGTLRPGDELELVKEENEWYRVKQENGDFGWISATYARIK